MNLPGLIEIVPLQKPVHAQITVPGSKSITNRALILAALANDETILHGALWSEDTQVMVEALLQLGFQVKVEPDQEEFSNRTIFVKGLGGKIPNAGTESKPLEIFVGNAGTAARFLASFICLGNGVYRLRGVPRMHERPQRALFAALRELGYKIDSTNDRLPAIIHATGPRSASCHVSIEESSQFASGLLLCAKRGEWRVTVTGENREESPYIAMTHKLSKVFPSLGGKFEIEGDASSGSYFVAANILALLGSPADGPRSSLGEAGQTSKIEVSNWPSSGWQVDAKFSALSSHRDTISRAFDLGDSIMTAIVLAPLGERPTKFIDLGRLRLQECERVAALRTELTKCGAKVNEAGDTLEVFPSKLHGVEIETYDDHRMAMCFSILGLKILGIRIRNPSCVKKTFPNFFQKLSAPPPHGLGVTILDGSTKRKLSLQELFPG